MSNLIFCGSNLTGAGILSTRLGGSIAVINGVMMGNNAGPTTGAQVGLVTAPNVASLNGLALTSSGLIRFATETNPPRMLAAGTLNVEIAAEPGTALVVLALALGVSGVGGVDASVPGGLLAFPDVYAVSPLLSLVPAADGAAMWAAPLPASLVAALTGLRVLFQAFGTSAAGVVVSTPSAVQFY